MRLLSAAVAATILFAAPNAFAEVQQKTAKHADEALVIRAHDRREHRKLVC